MSDQDKTVSDVRGAADQFAEAAQLIIDRSTKPSSPVRINEIVPLLSALSSVLAEITKRQDETLEAVADIYRIIDTLTARQPTSDA